MNTSFKIRLLIFSGEQWGQITQKTKEMVLLPTEGKTLVGFGRRPSGLRDLDNEGWY